MKNVPEPMQDQGKLWIRYQIYLASTPETTPKTFDEWLNS